MKLAVWPKTSLGKIAFICSAVFIILITIKMTVHGIPVPTFAIGFVGILGLILGIIAVIKKDRSLATYLAILVGIVILVFLALNVSSSLGLAKDFKVVGQLTKEEAGNSQGVLMNLGWISQKDDLIYYTEDNQLIRRKDDWTQRSILTENPVDGFFIADDSIYYTDSKDISHLYKMKIDGSGATLICDDNLGSFDVAGDWIYYTTKVSMSETKEIKEKIKDSGDDIKSGEISEELGTETLSKMKTDGSEKTVLAPFSSMFGGSINVLGDWIYYNVQESLYRVKTDGTGQSMISENATIGDLVDGWVYYLEKLPSENKGAQTITLMKMKEDGSEQTSVFTLENVYTTDFDQGFLYYTIMNGLNRIKLDGSSQEKINDVSIWQLDGVSGDWMVITDYGGPRFRVKIDGSVGTRIE